MNGDKFRGTYPVGVRVEFHPNSLMSSSAPLVGTVTGHIYADVAYITDDTGREWRVGGKHIRKLVDSALVRLG